MQANLHNITVTASRTGATSPLFGGMGLMLGRVDIRTIPAIGATTQTLLPAKGSPRNIPSPSPTGR